MGKVRERCSAAVATHELRLREDVALHRFLDVRLGGPGLEVELRVERVELEEVAVRGTGRRAGAAVADFAEIVPPLAGGAREPFALRGSLRELTAPRGPAVGHP